MGDGEMSAGWHDKKGWEFQLEVGIRPMDDFTFNVMRGQGGYFLIEVGGNRLVPDFHQTHLLHFTARTSNCGMDFFWSHFWPMFTWNVTMLGLCHAAWEASSQLGVLKLEKRCCLFPPRRCAARPRRARLPRSTPRCSVWHSGGGGPCRRRPGVRGTMQAREVTSDMHK